MSNFLEFDRYFCLEFGFCVFCWGLLVWFFFLALGSVRWFCFIGVFFLTEAEAKVLLKLDGLVRNVCILFAVAPILSNPSGMLPNLKPIRLLFLQDKIFTPVGQF